MYQIHFGTEGWRAVLAEGYTFDRVRAVARAAGRWFKHTGAAAPVAVGHDTRFLGARFAAAVADELAECGLDTRLCSGPLPTPAIGYYVVSSSLAGAVVLTASHNSAEWNGVKVRRAEGCSIFEEEAEWIETEANAILRSPPGEWAPERQHQRFDVRNGYVDRLLDMVDREAIARAKLTVVADLMHGAGAGYFDEALRRVGCAEVRAVRGDPDPTFEGRHPEPIGPNLEASTALTADPAVDIGLATDGDADRLGMMAHGEYVDVMRAIVLVLYQVLKNRQWRGRVVRAVDVTSMVDHLCAHFGVPVVETSIGFKNLAREMIESDDIILAVEESGGFGIRGHIPDRDGSLAALVACEALAYERKPLREVLADIFALAGGERFYDRLDIRLSPEERARLAERLPDLSPDRLAGQAVVEVNGLDGAKYLRRDGAWVMLRLSGTEPLVRVYAEGVSKADLRALLQAGQRLLGHCVGRDVHWC
jgi:phosphomannomutase